MFVASPREIQCVEAPPGVKEAYDLMVADGVPARTAGDMAIAAARSGKDPVAFAEHFVKLRKSLRG